MKNLSLNVSIGPNPLELASQIGSQPQSASRVGDTGTTGEPHGCGQKRMLSSSSFMREVLMNR